MVSRFNALADAVSAEVDFVFAEMVRFEPQTLREAYSIAGPEPDPDRAVRELLAVVREDRGQSHVRGVGREYSHGGGLPASPQADFASAPIVIKIAKILFDTPADWPRKGDKLVAIDRPGVPVFVVEQSMPDDRSRVRCLCVRELPEDEP